MFENQYVENILSLDKGHHIVALWRWSKEYPPFQGDLDMAKRGFFFLVEKFINDGVLKLASNGVLWEEPVEEQLKKFKDAWPEDYDSNVEEKDIDCLWWYIFAPAGAVWVYPGGKLVWT